MSSILWFQWLEPYSASSWKYRYNLTWSTPHARSSAEPQNRNRWRAVCKDCNSEGGPVLELQSTLLLHIWIWDYCDVVEVFIYGNGDLNIWQLLAFARLSLIWMICAHTFSIRYSLWANRKIWTVEQSWNGEKRVNFAYKCGMFAQSIRNKEWNWDVMLWFRLAFPLEWASDKTAHAATLITQTNICLFTSSFQETLLTGRWCFVTGPPPVCRLFQAHLLW